MSLFRGSIRKPGVGNHRDEEAGDQTNEHMEESKDECIGEIRKALWHVFDVLDSGNSKDVAVSQLKVIISQVGSRFNINKAEELLSQDGVTSMDFDTFYEVVKTKIIDEEKRTANGMVSFSQCANEVIKICFKLCDFERTHKSQSFTPEHCLLLWRLFNFLSETEENGDIIIPVQLDPAEASLIFREFIDVTGQRSKENVVVEFLKDNENKLMTFSEFLNFFEKEFISGLSVKDISNGLKPVFDRYILNVMEKGMMWKRGHKHKSWKERWLVLTPTHLSYYVTPKEKVLKGRITFDEECSVEVMGDRPTNKPNRFILHTTKKPYEMSAGDLKTKNEWISAIQKALERVGKEPNIQREAAHRRCCERRQQRNLATEEERKRREEAELLAKRQEELDEEKRKRLEDEELLRARLGELEAEKKKREEAEAHWLEEQRLREAEQQRLRELEEIKRELERLLDEERQAKKDEEIVRALQAKLLEEEFQKREELERLQEQQEAMLRAEREQKAVLESDREEQERLLADAKNRLHELELERLANEERMQEAANKLLKAEKDRQIMEEKEKLWKTPVGLARPIQPKANPLITHRGYGAFCDRDFMKDKSKNKSVGDPAATENTSDKPKQDTKLDEPKEMSDTSKQSDKTENDPKATDETTTNMDNDPNATDETTTNMDNDPKATDETTTNMDNDPKATDETTTHMDKLVSDRESTSTVETDTDDSVDGANGADNGIPVNNNEVEMNQPKSESDSNYEKNVITQEEIIDQDETHIDNKNDESEVDVEENGTRESDGESNSTNNEDENENGTEEKDTVEPKNVTNGEVKHDTDDKVQTENTENQIKDIDKGHVNGEVNEQVESIECSENETNEINGDVKDVNDNKTLETKVDGEAINIPNGDTVDAN